MSKSGSGVTPLLFEKEARISAQLVYISLTLLENVHIQKKIHRPLAAK
jgi:hypothetical protein